MKRRAGTHFERVRLEVALRVAEQESRNAVAAGVWQQSGNDILNLGGAMASCIATSTGVGEPALNT